MIRVLFVCTGNICRSPAAHGVMERLVADRGLAESIAVDSAGTHSYHVGELPDSRMRAHARRRGYELTHRARKVTPDDLAEFDYVLAMDSEHYEILQRTGRSNGGRVAMFLSVLPDSGSEDVPDPYYGGADGFEEVMDLVEAACAAWLHHICEEHGLT